MRDTLVILGAIAAALVVLTTVILGDQKPTALQKRLKRKRNLTTGEALAQAEKKLRWRKRWWVIAPAVAAVGLNVASLFAPTNKAPADRPPGAVVRPSGHR